MAWQTDHTDVVCKIFSSKLCAEANLVCLLQQLLFEVDVAECAACLVASGWQVIVVLYRGEFHGEEVLLCRGAANNECDMIRRTSRRAEVLHLLHKEWQQCAFILYRGLCHRIEIGLVSRAAALGHHHEAILVAFHCLDVYLCREIAACINLVVHV